MAMAKGKYLFRNELRCLAFVQDKFSYNFCVCLDFMNIAMIFTTSNFHLYGIQKFDYGN